MTADQARTGALEALDRVLNRGGDADDVLRETLRILHALYPYVGIRFVEEGALVAGPSVGAAAAAAAEEVPIVYGGIEVARLDVAGAAPDDRAFLERVALLVSPYCLVGWDTGGEAWEP